MTGAVPAELLAPPTRADRDALRRLGLRIAPGVYPAKTPAVPRLFDVASADPEKSEPLFFDSVMGLDHGRNILIDCTSLEDGTPLVALDIEMKNGLDGRADLAKLEQVHGKLPATFEQTTATTGGHAVYKVTAPMTNTVKKLAPSIDTRSHHGHLVGAGSVVPAGRYTANYLPVAQLPEAWEALLTKHVEPAPEVDAASTPDLVEDGQGLDRFVDYLLRNAPRSVKLSGGDDAAYRVACKGHDLGLTESATLDAMMSEAWDSGCGWTPERLAEKVAHAYRYAKGKAGNRTPESEFGAVDVPEMPPLARLTVEPRVPSEAEIAATFTARHGDSLLHCAELGRWQVWDGARFAPDTTNLVRDLIRQHVERIADEVRRRILAGGADKQGAADNAAARIASGKTAANAEHFAKSDRVHAVAAHTFDADPWTMSTQDGLLDLRSGQLRPHDRAARCSKITAAGFGGSCDAWLGLINHIVGGDEAFRHYLQKLSGYALTGSVREHLFAFLFGPAGTGKSRFTEALAYAMGDYSCTAAPTLFTARGDGQHPTALASLRGKRLVIAPELEQGTHWNESLLKSFTSGDRTTARFMRQDNIEFTPEALLMFTGNHQPHARNVSDGGLRRRMVLLPFDRKPDAPDKELPARLIAEASGILAWAAEGTRMWLAEGLEPPAAIRAATDTYFEDEDDVGRWLAERTDINTAAFVESAVLYADWAAWAQAGGGYVGTLKRFVSDLARRNHAQAKHPATRRAGFRGLVLRHPYTSPGGME